MISSEANASIKNGNAIPKVYTRVNKAPWKAPFPPDAARANTELKTGPIHGVQPKLKLIPSKKADRYLLDCFFLNVTVF